MVRPRPVIGLVAALPVESAAARLMVDELEVARAPGDSNLYHVGQVPSRTVGRPHRVALATQVQDGTRHAAALATAMARSFPSLRHIVMSGIAAGIPLSADGSREIRLGDVVTTAEGLVDYGSLRITDDSAQLRRPVDGLSRVMLRADRELAAREVLGDLPWLDLVDRLADQAPPTLRRPEPGRPRVHRTTVASADWLVRNAGIRDGLADRFGVRAVEMEGSGIAVGTDLQGLDWYMVRGISDFADAAKADRWHGYAALVAAAYTRALLGEVQPVGAGPERQHSDGLGEIVNSLLSIPLMRDDLQRRAVLAALPGSIRAQIPDNQVGRLHVLALVQTCQRFPDGDTALLAALELVLGEESEELSRVAQAVEQYWPLL